MTDYLTNLLDVPRKFTKDSTQLLQRCTKPDKREFVKIAQAVGMGFLMMGFIGYFIKLIHIPINNIIGGFLETWTWDGPERNLSFHIHVHK